MIANPHLVVVRTGLFESFYQNGKIYWGFGDRYIRDLCAVARVSGKLVYVFSIIGGYLCRADGLDSAMRTKFDIECFVTLKRYRQVETYQVLAEKSLAALLRKERRKRRLNRNKGRKRRRRRQRENKQRH